MSHPNTLAHIYAHMLSYLPVLCDSIPHPNLPCVARSHQLVANEEEIINRYAEAEYPWGGWIDSWVKDVAVRLQSQHFKSLWCEPTYFITTASILDAPEDDTALRGSGHHLVLVSMRPTDHLRIERDAFNGPVKVGGGEHLLPSRRFLYPVMRSHTHNIFPCLHLKFMVRVFP